MPAVAAKNSERDGIGLLPLTQVAKLGGKRTKTSTTSGTLAAATTTVTIDPRKSLIVTDINVLKSAVPILTVLNTLAAGSPTPITARQVYDPWMDTNNVKPGLNQGGHCDDEVTNGVPTKNTFQYDCPRAEGGLVGTNPTDGNPNAFTPIAVVNRFDLATDPRKGGTDCGEYRIVYAKKSGMTIATNRMLLIFEGVMPNPTPNGTDLTGCRPVAQFWADLANAVDDTDRINRLKTFFFTGLPGFEPAAKASHFGLATPNASGQIRTNAFMQFNWILREYRVAIVNNKLAIQAHTDATNPPGLLFDETDPNAKGPQFRSDFINVVSSLAINDINGFNANGLSSTSNSADSDEQSGTKTNYSANIARSPNFQASIQTQLVSIGSTLSPQNIADRMQAMSCAGCHQLSNGKNLGGGLTWPSSLGFVHVSEAQQETVNGVARYKTSPALDNVFLPHRKAVLEAFLNGV